MADTITEQWVYPPNWDENPPTKGGCRTIVKRFTCISDGTGETDVTKIDISGLRTISGAVPVKTVVESVSYIVNGFTSVVIEWDRAPNSVVCVLSDHSGSLDFTMSGGLVDPSGAGDRTGDILLTSNGASSGDVYDITITLRLKE